MNIMKALNWRYAVRKFSADKLDEAEVQTLLDTARLAPSSYGLQPYRLLVVQSPQTRRQLLPYSMGQEKVLHCSHLIVFAAQTDIGDETVERYIAQVARVREVPWQDLGRTADRLKSALAGKSAREGQEWAHQQAYIALGSFLTCAALMGIDACPMTGFEAEGFDKVLGLTEQKLTATVICAIGKRHPEDAAAGLPKVRFGYDELIVTV